MSHCAQSKAIRPVPPRGSEHVDRATVGRLLPAEPAELIAALAAELHQVAIRGDWHVTDEIIRAIVEWHILATRQLLMPLYFLEKAEQCFRLADGGGNVRAGLEAMGLDFTKTASEIEASLQRLRSAALQRSLGE